jgi:hypothetical protein
MFFILPEGEIEQGAQLCRLWKDVFHRSVMSMLLLMNGNNVFQSSRNGKLPPNT